MHYDNDKSKMAGNTRDDGTPSGFSGCQYSLPASGSDSFTNVAPNLGASLRLTEDTRLFGNLARGFRAPQTTELYRLQNGQQVARLESESIDSVELGIRLRKPRWSADIAVFAMRKRDSVLRDSDGFNISGGRSRHEGIELAFDWRLLDTLRFKLNSSYARHVYDFDLVAARGETFVSGNDVDTAPRWLGSAELLFEPGNGFDASLLWTAIGDYYLDAENSYTYTGHDLVNLRAGFELSPRFTISARLNNALDTDYADRADFAFGAYRYFPGRGRELFVELQYLPNAVGN